MSVPVGATPGDGVTAEQAQEVALAGPVAAEDRRLIFGEAPEQHHRHRPGYPPALIDQVVGLAGVDGRVLDVGAGTGKPTADLLGRGLVVSALEPSPEMAAVLLRTTIGSDVAVSVLEVGFEDLPIPSSPYDVVVAGQSWHWLRPGTRLDVAARALGGPCDGCASATSVSGVE